MVHRIKLDEDSQLMLKVADGNKKAFEQLYCKYLPILRRFLAGRNSRHLLLEDVIQKIFTHVWEQRKSFRAESSFQTYLFGTAKNVLNAEENEFRKANIVRWVMASSFRRKPMGGRLDASSPNIDRLLDDAMNKLPARSMQAIKLRYLDDLSTPKAAKIVGCSLRAFRKRLYRAKNQLRDLVNRMKLSD